MVRNKWRLVLRLLVLFAIAVTSRPDSAASEERPFKARVEGNAHLKGAPPIVENDETGEGEATHLGHFIWEDVEFVDFSLFPVQLSVVGTFTMTAANGDKLFGSLAT